MSLESKIAKIQRDAEKIRNSAKNYLGLVAKEDVNDLKNFIDLVDTFIVYTRVIYATWESLQRDLKMLMKYKRVKSYDYDKPVSESIYLVSERLSDDMQTFLKEEIMNALEDKVYDLEEIRDSLVTIAKAFKIHLPAI